MGGRTERGAGGAGGVRGGEEENMVGRLVSLTQAPHHRPEASVKYYCYY